MRDPNLAGETLHHNPRDPDQAPQHGTEYAMFIYDGPQTWYHLHTWSAAASIQGTLTWL